MSQTRSGDSRQDSTSKQPRSSRKRPASEISDTVSRHRRRSRESHQLSNIRNQRSSRRRSDEMVTTTSSDKSGSDCRKGGNADETKSSRRRPISKTNIQNPSRHRSDETETTSTSSDDGGSKDSRRGFSAPKKEIVNSTSGESEGSSPRRSTRIKNSKLKRSSQLQKGDHNKSKRTDQSRKDEHYHLKEPFQTRKDDKKTSQKQKTRDGVVDEDSEQESEEDGVEIIAFPSTIDVLPGVVTDDTKEPLGSDSVLFRLKSGVHKQEPALNEMRRLIEQHGSNPSKLSQFLESNGRIVTWSDGSRTIDIGESQFVVAKSILDEERPVMIPKGDGEQNVHERVRRSSRVFPTSTTFGIDLMNFATKHKRKKRLGREKSAAPKSEVRLISFDEQLRVEKEAAHISKEIRAQNALRRDERQLLAVRNRRLSQKTVQRNMDQSSRISKAKAKISNGLESSDDEGKQLERVLRRRKEAEQLGHGKRLIHSIRPSTPAPKRKKVGKRHIVEDESSEESREEPEQQSRRASRQYVANERSNKNSRAISSRKRRRGSKRDTNKESSDDSEPSPSRKRRR